MYQPDKGLDGNHRASCFCSSHNNPAYLSNKNTLHRAGCPPFSPGNAGTERHQYILAHAQSARKKIKKNKKRKLLLFIYIINYY